MKKLLLLLSFMSISLYAQDIEIYNRILEPIFPEIISFNKFHLLPEKEKNLINEAIHQYHAEKTKLDVHLLPAIVDTLHQKVFLEQELRAMDLFYLSDDELTRKQAIELVMAEKDSILYNLETIKLDKYNVLYSDLKLKISTILNQWRQENPKQVDLLLKY